MTSSKKSFVKEMADADIEIELDLSLDDMLVAGDTWLTDIWFSGHLYVVELASCDLALATASSFVGVLIRCSGRARISCFICLFLFWLNKIFPTNKKLTIVGSDSYDTAAMANSHLINRRHERSVGEVTLAIKWFPTHQSFLFPFYTALQITCGW